MTQIQELTQDEIVSRTASMMNLSKSRLQEKAKLVGLDTTGSKVELISRILSKSSRIETEKPKFDYSGLMIRI